MQSICVSTAEWELDHFWAMNGAKDGKGRQNDVMMKPKRQTNGQNCRKKTTTTSARHPTTEHAQQGKEGGKEGDANAFLERTSMIAEHALKSNLFCRSLIR